MSGNKKTIQISDNCEWKRRYEDGLFKWVVSCENMVVLRQDRDDDPNRVCGYCGKPVYFFEGKVCR